MKLIISVSIIETMTNGMASQIILIVLHFVIAKLSSTKLFAGLERFSASSRSVRLVNSSLTHAYMKNRSVQSRAKTNTAITRLFDQIAASTEGD